MTRQPVLVGEHNPYGEDPKYALFCHPVNSAGERLQRLVLGMQRAAYVALVRRNLCAGRWSNTAARAAAHALLELFPEPEYRFVLLGARVAGAFRTPFEPFTVQESTYVPARSHVVLPHPSGLCRLWNEPHALERARAVMVAEFPGLPLGVLEGSS